MHFGNNTLNNQTMLYQKIINIHKTKVAYNKCKIKAQTIEANNYTTATSLDYTK